MGGTAGSRHKCRQRGARVAMQTLCIPALDAWLGIFTPGRLRPDMTEGIATLLDLWG